MSDETCCGACGYPVHATKEMACDWCRQAADRIEALTKERDQWRRAAETRAEGWKISDDARIEAEIKLAKAVEALGDIVKDCEADYPPSHGAIKHFARATLAVIKGGNDAESNL